MKYVSFDNFDAGVLYSIPTLGGTLGDFGRIYAFRERVAVPSNDDVLKCVKKAISAGIVNDRGGYFCVNSDWYKIIHKHDNVCANEFESMFKFEDLLLSKEWPCK